MNTVEICIIRRQLMISYSTETIFVKASDHMFISRASSCVAVLRQVHLDSRAQDAQKRKGLLDAAPFPSRCCFPQFPQLRSDSCTFSAGSVSSSFVRIILEYIMPQSCLSVKSWQHQGKAGKGRGIQVAPKAIRGQLGAQAL